MGLFDNLKKDVEGLKENIGKVGERIGEIKQKNQARVDTNRAEDMKRWKKENTYNRAKATNLKGKQKVRDARGEGLGGLFGASTGSASNINPLFGASEKDKKDSPLF